MAADPYLLQGAIPFGQGGNPYQGGGIQGLAPAYQQSYNSALAQNQALYGNILQGYQQTLGNQANVQQGIQAGYGQLGAQVQGTIAGIGASQSQNIADVYAQQQGQATQQLTNAGLGNTTVTNSVNRGLGLDKQKADIALANQMAQLSAGYQSNLGLAGLNYANQASMQNTGEANQQLGWMNTVQAQYPNAGAYNQLAQMYGQQGQANADRQLMQTLGTQQHGVGGVSGGGAGARGSGSVSSNAGNFGLYSHPLLPDTSMSNYGGGGGQQPMGNQGGLSSGYTQLQPTNNYNTGIDMGGMQAAMYGPPQGQNQYTGDNLSGSGGYGNLDQYSLAAQAEAGSFSDLGELPY